MAERKAIERTATVDDSANVPKGSVPSKLDPTAQGESLFLPYLVEHLRSSLQQQPIPPARRRRHEHRHQTPQQHLQTAPQYSTESGRVEDSGTESGEDLRFLAAGLRDSIELHRQGASREQDSSQSILSEVQSALSRLQASLQQGCIGNEHVDRSKQDSLLRLIERLQSSLQLPCAGTSWQQKQKQMKPADLPSSGNAQELQNTGRFAGRRNRRAHRHTVGVTREELADVRRFLEEAEMRSKMCDVNKLSQDEEKPPEVPPLPISLRSPYDLIKQSSAGDVPTTTSFGPSAFRPFRPAHFLPKKFEDPCFSSTQFQGMLGDESRKNSTGGIPGTKQLTQVKKPPDNPLENDDVETEDEDDVDEDEDSLVEEGTVTAKPFQPVRAGSVSESVNPSMKKDEYDPSSKLFTPSQSVQIAVHKAAINKQLSVEEEKRQEKKVVLSETSDEDTMTDASYESETEKAESDGYEEEDKEDEEEDNDSVILNSSSKNNPPVPGGIVRNLTFTIKPNSSPPKQSAVSNPNPARKQNQNTQDTSHSDRRQDLPSQYHQNQYKNQLNQRPQDNRFTQNETRASNNKHSAQKDRDLNPPKQAFKHSPSQEIHHHVNPIYIEKNPKQNQQSKEQLNGKTVKSQVAQPKKVLTQAEMAKKSFHLEDKQKMRSQDQNNNCSFIQTAEDERSLSSAQKVLQMAAADTPKSARFANRQLKKQKMKRANTIDIPKPLHHYGVEGDSEISSEEDSQASQESPQTPDGKHKISVQESYQKAAEYAASMRQRQVEQERRGSNPQKLEKKIKNIFEQHPEADCPRINPQAHGGTQWNNRFANIKTCFENPVPVPKESSVKQPEKSNKARSFWRSADDSALKVSKNSAFHDPKLTKHGSQLLKKLHEQKDQGQPLPKLPWTSAEHENVVVGSLVVPANLQKTKQSSQHQNQSPLNKFSHAPMSAFRPIQKKNEVPAAHSGWAAPSVTGSVKQIASSKFSQPDTQSPVPASQPAKHDSVGQKQTARTNTNLQAPPTSQSPISPTLPWTKDVSHGHALNSTLAKFESMSSRESSPQLTPGTLLRSHSQDRVNLQSNLAVFNKTVPAPPPRTYIPVPPTNIVQTRTQNLNAPFRHEQALPLIYEQAQSHPLAHSKSNQYVPQSNNYSGLMKNQALFDRSYLSSDSEMDEPPPSSSRLVLSTLQGNIEPRSSLHNTNAPKVQTYSAGVTARQSVYGIVRNPVLVPKSSPPEDRDALFESHFEPELSHPKEHLTPGEFGEEHTAAVTRVMGRPQCGAAVTVSHRTRHYNEEEEGGRGSAAFHLTSLLHKFSSDDDVQPHKSPTSSSPSNSQKLVFDAAKRSISSSSPAKEQDQWTPPAGERPTPEMRRPPAPAQPSELPPRPDVSPRLPRADHFSRSIESPKDNRVRPAQIYQEPPRQVTVDRFPREPQRHEEISPDFVYANRFEIPINKVQNITQRFQSGITEFQNGTGEERKLPASPNPGVVLRKSESWHQLAAQQQGLNRRPQSLVVSDLPPVQPRSPNALPKAKSSHSLAFPKQFEAAIKPETLEQKQKTVEEFFKKGKVDVNFSPSNSLPRETKSRVRVQASQSFSEKRSYSSESSNVLLVDDNIDNVDEAFESLFNATTESKARRKSSALNNKGSRIANR